MDESPDFVRSVMEGIQRLYRIEHWFRENMTQLSCPELIRRTQSRKEKLTLQTETAR